MRTSKFSLAVLSALGLMSSAVSANNLIDIKLPDNSWKLIGVNGGFNETGAVNTSTMESATETVDDNSFTSIPKGDSALPVVSFMVINHTSSSEFTSAVMTIDTAVSDYSATYAMREMYVKDEAGNLPDVRIKYQANYEGATFYLTLGTNNYSGTFESNATYSNPQSLTSTSSSTANVDGNLNVSYILDRNISNNPGQVGKSGIKNDYVQATHQDAMSTTDAIRIYWYDADAGQWKAYVKSNNTVLANDFSALEKGKAYWVKFDHAGNTNEAGLILGEVGISATDYTNVSPVEGWNLLSFNDAMLTQAGATGLIIEIDRNSSVNIALKDLGGIDSVDVNITVDTVTGHDNNISQVAQGINKKIAQAKAYGALFKNFNLVAYPSATESNIILISDKQFKIVGSSGTTDGVSQAWDLNYSGSSGLDVNDTGVTSTYGQYVLGLRLASNNASFTDNYFAVNDGKIDFNGTNNISLKTSMSTAQTNLETNTTTIRIDTNFDGLAETILVVEPENFYVRDLTIVKPYLALVETSGSVSGRYVIDLNGSYDINITANESNTTTNFSTEINTAGNGLKLYSAVSSGYLYVGSSNTDIKDFKVNQSYGTSRLKLITDPIADFNASGTIQEVYTLENLARAGIKYYEDYNTTTVTLVVEVNETNGISVTDKVAELNISNLAIDYNGTSGRDYNVSIKLGVGLTSGSYSATTTDSDITYSLSNREVNVSIASGASETNETYATALSEVINRYFDTYSTSNLKATATTTATATATPTVKTTVTITGQFFFESNDTNATYDNIRFSPASTKSTTHTRVDQTGSTITKGSTESNISTIKTLVDDLGYNKVFATVLPVSQANPVVTLQEQTNLKVKKVLSTNENSSGSLGWNFVDLTKDNTEWFDATDSYNLFSFEKEKGYWVYLINDGSQPGDIAGKVTISGILYDHDILNDTASNTDDYTTVNAIRDGAITVDVTGLANASFIDRGIATIGGKEISLTPSGNRWTANFSEYSLGNLGSGTLNVTATLFTKENFYTTASTSFDKSIPAKPTTSLTNGDTRTVAIVGSTGVTNYLYSTDINESDLTKNKLDSNFSTGYNLCAKASSFSTDLGAYRMISVSGTGEFNKNPASGSGRFGDAYNDVFYPIYKNASIVGVDATTTSNSVSKSYDATCQSTTIVDNGNTGFTLVGNNGNSVTISYETNTSIATDGLSPNDIKIVQVKVDGTHVATINFDGRLYASTSSKYVFVNYAGAIYRTTLAALHNADGGSINFTSSNIYMTTGQVIAY